MPSLDDMTPPELAELLQQAYASDHDLPGDQLTDPAARYDLAQLLDSDEVLRAAVVEAWLEDLEDWETLEVVLLYWLDATFLGGLELPDREED